MLKCPICKEGCMEKTSSEEEFDIYTCEVCGKEIPVSKSYSATLKDSDKKIEEIV